MFGKEAAEFPASRAEVNDIELHLGMVILSTAGQVFMVPLADDVTSYLANLQFFFRQPRQRVMCWVRQHRRQPPPVGCNIPGRAGSREVSLLERSRELPTCKVKKSATVAPEPNASLEFPGKTALMTIHQAPPPPSAMQTPRIVIKRTHCTPAQRACKIGRATSEVGNEGIVVAQVVEHESKLVPSRRFRSDRPLGGFRWPTEAHHDRRHWD